MVGVDMEIDVCFSINKLKNQKKILKGQEVTVLHQLFKKKKSEKNLKIIQLI